MQIKQSVINSNIRASVIAAFGVLSMVLAVSGTAQAQANQPTPLVFQAAGPDAASIQSAVDAPGLGLSQAPPSGGAQGGLAVLFGNPTYAKIFTAFSRSRLFTPVGSNITEASFSIPGTNGTAPAAVRGFGAVFTDVDQQPDGILASTKRGSTFIQFFDRNGRLLFSSFVAASPGDGSLSFLGIKFDDARIASVRIQAGDVAPGPNDDKQHDIVMMDDFIYGEPELLN